MKAKNLKKLILLLCCTGVCILVMMSSCGDNSSDVIVIELYPEYAPGTVENFLRLAESGFYDGVGFHRIVDDFMAQGGDPDGTGMGGSSETIFGEFASNGFTQNTLRHTKGIISMARIDDPNSASSQFFIMLADDSFLDGNYAAFGKVIEGMDIVESFQKVERTMGLDRAISKPVNPVTMKKVTVLNTEGNPKVQIEMEKFN